MSFAQLSATAATLVLIVGLIAPAAAENENDARAKRFVEYYEATVRPLEIEAARCFWTANVTGKEEDFQKKQEAEEKVDLCLSDPERFAELKAIKESRGLDKRPRESDRLLGPPDRRPVSANIWPSRWIATC